MKRKIKSKTKMIFNIMRLTLRSFPTAFAVMLITLYLTGCAGHMRTTLSTYRVDTLPLSGSVRIVPAENAKHDELEFLYFSERLQATLNEHGYSVSTDENADILVYLDFSVKRRQRNENNSPRLFGSFGYQHYRAGTVVLLDDERDEFEYVRRVDINFAQPATDREKKVLKISAVSVGGCPYLVSVYDAMVHSIVDNLDKPNGSVVTVKGNSARRCTE